MEKTTPAKNAYKRWTKDEEKYVQEAWGNASLIRISNKLGRSKKAVIAKIQKMGLPPAWQSGERITFNQFAIALSGKANNHTWLMEKFTKAGFPIHKRAIRGEKKYNMVDIGEFWQFAEKHKKLFDLSKMEENIFGEEPEWAAEKRRADKERRRGKNGTKWTSGDDYRLRRMLRENCHTYTDIARRMGRSEQAIHARIYRLGLVDIPVRAKHVKWSKAEEHRLMEMASHGHSYGDIAQELGRSAISVLGRYAILKQRVEGKERV